MYISKDEILFVISLVCALVKLFQNIEQNLDNNYKIIPIFSINKYLQLPAVSICLTDFLDEKRFQKRFPEIAEEIGNLSRLKDKKLRRQLYDRITLKKLSLASYSLDDFLESCQILDNQMNKVNCAYLSPVVTWISFEDKCFQFFAFRGQYQKRFFYNRDLLVDQEWLTLIIKKERIRKNDIGILVSSPHDLLQPFSYNTGYIQISTTLLSTLYIVIARSRTNRLPYPFESNCHNYTGHSLSQMHCVFDCYYHKFRPLGKYPDQLLTRYPEELYGLNLDKVNRSECTEQCRKKDCVIDKFKLSVSYKKLDLRVPTVKLVLKASFSQEKRLNFVPSTRNRNILSIVSFILSPLAFFCGISLFTIQLYIVNVAVYLIAIFIKIKKLCFTRK